MIDITHINDMSSDALLRHATDLYRQIFEDGAVPETAVLEFAAAIALHQHRTFTSSTTPSTTEFSLTKKLVTSPQGQEFCRIKDFRRLVKAARAIVDSESPWEEKFHSVFAMRKVQERLAPHFTWMDPDLGYEDDVMAYVQALEQKVADLEPIYHALLATD